MLSIIFLIIWLFSIFIIFLKNIPKLKISDFYDPVCPENSFKIYRQICSKGCAYQFLGCSSEK